MKLDGKILALIVIVVGFGVPPILKWIYKSYREHQELERIQNDEYDWSGV